MFRDLKFLALTFYEAVWKTATVYYTIIMSTLNCLDQGHSHIDYTSDKNLMYRHFCHTNMHTHKN